MHTSLMLCRVDLIARVSNNWRGGTKNVECVDEAVQAHRGGGRKSELDDLCRAEYLAKPAIERIVHCVMIGGKEIDKLDCHSLLCGQLRVPRSQQTLNVRVGDRVVLA